MKQTRPPDCKSDKETNFMHYPLKNEKLSTFQKNHFTYRFKATKCCFARDQVKLMISTLSAQFKIYVLSPMFDSLSHMAYLFTYNVEISLKALEINNCFDRSKTS